MHKESDPLAELIRSGDAEAISRELYPVVREMVKSVLRDADPHLTTTAAHDALLNVCRYHRTFRGSSRATSWLYIVARRAALRARRASVPPPGEVPLDEVRAGTDPPVFLRPDDALALLELAVPNPAWRRIWLLWNQPGAQRTHEDVARLTGYTPGSVQVTLSRVRGLIARVVQSE